MSCSVWLRSSTTTTGRSLSVVLMSMWAWPSLLIRSPSGGASPVTNQLRQTLVHAVVGSAGDRGDLMDRDGARVERRVHVQLRVGPLSELERDSRSETGQAVAVRSCLRPQLFQAGPRDVRTASASFPVDWSTMRRDSAMPGN